MCTGARTRCRARSDRYDHRLRGGRETRRQDGGQQRGGDAKVLAELDACWSRRATRLRSVWSESVKGLLSQPNTYLPKLLQTADASSGDLVSASGPHSDRRSAKSTEPRGAITPGSELRLMSGGQDVRRGHRGMGIRRSRVKNRKAGVSGDGVAVRLPNKATLRSVRRHIPLYVGICVQPYCGQHR